MATSRVIRPFWKTDLAALRRCCVERHEVLARNADARAFSDATGFAPHVDVIAKSLGGAR